MRTVVLAAGTGSRLGEITNVRTKGMVPVKGRLLIDYLLDFLDFDIMDEIIVVGGFCYEDLKEHIEKKYTEKVRVIENKDYLKGNIYTLTTALKEFDNDSFLITNVDHIYPSIMFNKMKESFAGITAMCDFDRTLGADDMKVKLTGDKKVKEMSKQLTSFDCGYIGMSYIDKSMNDTYRNSIEKAISKFGEKAVVENIIHVLAENAETAPSICDLSGFGWYEIDTPEELKEAESRIVDDINFSYLR